MLTSSSVVVAGAAQVLVAASRGGRRRRRQRLAVEPGLQDRLDGVIAEGADSERSAGGGLQALVTEAPAMAEDAEAGAVALLRCGRDSITPRTNSAVAGPVFSAPFSIRLGVHSRWRRVRGQHVGGVGGVLAAPEAAHMASVVEVFLRHRRVSSPLQLSAFRPQSLPASVTSSRPATAVESIRCPPSSSQGRPGVHRAYHNGIWLF
jgi:hypothetical protein